MDRLAQDSISLFIPMEWNYEGYIDSYGYPVFETPKNTRSLDLSNSMSTRTIKNGLIEMVKWFKGRSK